MSLEYMFFDAALRDGFMAFAGAQGVAASSRPDPIEGWVVALPDDLAGSTQSVIDTEYDRLLDCQRELADAQDGQAALDLLGVNVTLPDGRACLVRLPAEYGRRLIEHFRFDEIEELVRLIARDVADPSDGPLCRERTSPGGTDVAATRPDP